MDKELNEIYCSLAKYSSIDGINEIREEMEELSSKLTEYKGMARINSYNVPSIICQIDKYNVSLEGKYNNYFEKFNNAKYNINVFGASNDSFEQKIESSLNVLGKIAVSKICNYYGVDLSDRELWGNNADVLNNFKNAMDNRATTGDDDIDTKMSFKIIY